MPELRLANLGIAGLAGVSLSVQAGECVSVEGPSGCGKTRLLRAIADLDPHGGEVFLEDVASTAMSPPAWRRAVALLPAEIVWWRTTAREHFAGDAAVPVAELDLEEAVLRQPLEQLSTGQRQRLALLRLVQHAPRALLLDEPTAALDVASRGRVEAFVRRYRERTRAAVIWIGHDRDQLSRVATRHFAINEGVLREIHTPSPGVP